MGLGRYQQKLQQNLLYLAAIADSQPQPAVNVSQVLHKFFPFMSQCIRMQFHQELYRILAQVCNKWILQIKAEISVCICAWIGIVFTTVS